MLQILLKLLLIGNRTSCHPIRSVFILVIKQTGLPLRGRPILLITRMITDRIGLYSVLFPLLIIIINYECSMFLDMMNDKIDKKQQRYIIKKMINIAIRATYYMELG